MYSIVMDTSTNYLVVGLLKDGVFLEKRQMEALQKQSEEAVPALEEVLKLHGLKVKDIDEAIVTIGPGSYTGVRVALTIIKTFEVILPIKVKAISSLEIYKTNQPTLALIDARSKKAYVGIYDENHAEETLMSLTDLQEWINAHKEYVVRGQRKLVGLEDEEYDLNEMIYQASLNHDYVEDVKALIPNYIKGVEVSKKHDR